LLQLQRLSLPSVTVQGLKIFIGDMENNQAEIEKLTLRIDKLQAEIDKAKQNGNDEEARSLRGLQTALVNDRVEVRKLLIQQQAGIQNTFILLFNLLFNHFFQHQQVSFLRL